MIRMNHGYPLTGLDPQSRVCPQGGSADCRKGHSCAVATFCQSIWLLRLCGMFSEQINAHISNYSAHILPVLLPWSILCFCQCSSSSLHWPAQKELISQKSNTLLKVNIKYVFIYSPCVCLDFIFFLLFLCAVSQPILFHINI